LSEKTAVAELPFRKIVIVGFGLIGGSVAAAIKSKFPRAVVIGVDKLNVGKKAVESHVIDKFYAIKQLYVAISQANLVILATSIAGIIAVIKKNYNHIALGALITDAGGTKSEIMRGRKRIFES